MSHWLRFVSLLALKVVRGAKAGSALAFLSLMVLPTNDHTTDLATSVAGAQWIVKGYMLMLGALILVGGAAGDRFGRRRVFAWALLSSRPRPLAAAWRPASQF